MRKFLLLLLATHVFGFTNIETGWEYTQTPGQCFYMAEYVYIDNVEATGDGYPGNVYGECIYNPYSCDVIGAFIERDENIFGDLNDDGEISSAVDVCVGWGFAKSEGWTTIPLIGKDPSVWPAEAYLDDGEIPFFRIYDHVNDAILPLEISNIYYTEELEDLNGDGIWNGEVEAEPFVDTDGDGIYDEAEDFTDENENGVWDDGEPWYDGNNVWDEGEDFTDENGNGVWDEGEFFIDQGNGVYDEGEDFTDVNGNGQWDDYIPEESFTDINSNGIWDGTVSGELNGWGLNEIFLYFGSFDAYNSFGCNDEDACNEDEDATADDGSCVYSPSGELTTQVTVSGNSFELSWDDGDLEGTAEFSHQVIISEGFTEIYNEINAQSPIELSNLDWSTTYSIDIITTNFEICDSLVTNIAITTDSLELPGFVNNETNWFYIQTTQQCFYMFEEIIIDDTLAVGDGEPGNVYGECANNPYSCDVVGSFIQRDENDFGVDLNYDGQISSSADVCVGWSYVNSDGWSTLQLLGIDFDTEESMGYLNDGEVPFLKIYDSSSDNIYDLSIDNIYYEEYFEDENQNGTWDEGEVFQDLNGNGLWDGTISGELFGWSQNNIYLYYGYLENDIGYGCTDSEAQNYDPEATIDDGSCIFGPTLISIYDAPDDQGGYVFINWEANSLDVLPNEVITHYSIFRYLPNERGWELLDEISANYFSDYGYVAPTIQTSIPEQGLIYETDYFVRAHTS